MRASADRCVRTPDRTELGCRVLHRAAPTAMELWPLLCLSDGEWTILESRAFHEHVATGLHRRVALKGFDEPVELFEVMP